MSKQSRSRPRRNRRPSRPTALTTRTPRSSSSPAPAPTAEKKASERARPSSLGGKFWHFFLQIGVAYLLTAVIITIVAVAALMFSATPLSHLPITLAQGWLATHLAPIVLDGVTLSFLPLLPAVIATAIAASRVHSVIKTKVSMVDLGVVFAVGLVVPALITTLSWFGVKSLGTEYDMTAPHFGFAVGRTVVLYFFSLCVGMGPRLWTAVLKRYSLPGELVAGVRAAIRFFGILAGLALITMIILALTGTERQQAMVDSYPDHAPGLGWGLGLVSLLYLPNALVACASVLLGGDFVIGQGSVSLFGINLVPLPPTPLTALIPGEVSSYAPVLMVLAAAAACAVWVLARPTVSAVIGGVIIGGLAALGLGFLASGELGSYGWAGPTWWLPAVLSAVWLACSGLATIAAIALADRRAASAEPVQIEQAQVEEEVEEETETIAAEPEAAEEESDEEDAVEEPDSPEVAPDSGEQQPETEQDR